MFKIWIITLSVFGAVIWLMFVSAAEMKRKSDLIRSGQCEATGRYRTVDRGHMQNMGSNINIWIPNVVTEDEYRCRSGESFWH